MQPCNITHGNVLEVTRVSFANFDICHDKLETDSTWTCILE